MDNELINEQIQQLRARQHTESIKITNPNCFYITYSPQATKSPYSHLVFNVKVTIPVKYPDVPPALNFIDKIYHLNVVPISGQVIMPILKDDWSPFLTLSMVFESLDCILEEPDPKYAATEILKSEYTNDPQKYASKVNQMVNLCASQQKDNLNQSIVEHVEEIQEFKQTEGLLLNNSFQKNQNAEKGSTLKHSLPFSEIPKNLKESIESPVYQKGNQIKIQTASENATLIKDKSELFHFNPIKQAPQQKVPRPITLESQNDKIVGQSLNILKKSLSKNRSSSPQKKEQFDQVQQNLRKSDQLIELLLQGCQSMENTLNNSRNSRIKQLLEKKLQCQWKMVQQLLEMTSKLKQKLFNDLKLQTRQLLK